LSFKSSNVFFSAFKYKLFYKPCIKGELVFMSLVLAKTMITRVPRIHTTSYETLTSKLTIRSRSPRNSYVKSYDAFDDVVLAS